MSTLSAIIKALLFLIITLLLAPVQIILLCFHKGKGAYLIPCFWEKLVCLIFRIKIEVIGSPHTQSQTIFVCNHISYLDIPAIGSIVRASFVAKQDVAKWPIFGFLSKLQQTAFISRDRSDAKKEKNALDTMLDEGKSLIIFPEGTSTDGREVRNFKSSLFAIAFKENIPDVMVQPMTLSMKYVDQKDVTSQEIRDIYAWHIDMDTPMGSHLWAFAKSKGATITIEFHEAIKAQSQKDRKTLAKLCHERVSNGLEKQHKNNMDKE